MLEKYFTFRPATATDGSWNLLKTGFQTSIFWTVFLLLIPLGIQLLESYFGLPHFEALIAVGWVCFTSFSILGIYSGYTMSWYGKGTPLPIDCPNLLVINGPYKYIRNPMAVAGIGQGISVGLLYGSYFIVLYALTGAVLWHIVVRPDEERDLEARFGSQFTDYKKKVKCWLPTGF